MTHILITDLREIRYMAYVPEGCTHVGSTMRDAIIYRKELEKAKRESVPFENQDAIREILGDHIDPHNKPLFKPGIYQVPVEKPEIVEVFSHCTRDEKHYVKVARLKSSYKEKEESQEELIQAFFDMVAEHGENLSYSELSKHFTLTRKRG